jgi:LysR family transcriptional regulator, transcription activator of glutamate synthase operon
MDIRKIELFVDLTKTLDYTETADRFYTTQSNVSKSIMSLEKELDVQLFDRSHRKIALSEEGDLALDYAKKVLKNYQELQSALTSFKKQRKLHLTIFFIPTAPDYQGFSKISDFMKAYPEIDIELKETEAKDISYLIEKTDDSIAFARTWEAPQKKERIFETEEDDFVALLPKNHPLAKQEIIELSQLKNEHLLLQSENSMIYQKIMELAKQENFIPQVTYKGVRVAILASMVAKEMGISIMMRKSIQEQLNDKVVLIPLSPNKVSHLSFITSKTKDSKSVELFLDYLEK